MGIKRHALVKTNEGLVGANGKQNKLDGVMFLDLTLGLRTHQVTCLFPFPGGVPGATDPLLRETKGSTDLYRAGAPPKIYQ